MSKIERLPGALRLDLNRRLRDGQTTSQILSWLNARATVREILRKDFDGAPVNHENLSHYRHQGFSEWLAEQFLNSGTND